MPTFTALTTLSGKPAAEALGEAMERLNPEPTGIGVFEVEDGSGLWEVGGYFTEHPDETALSLLSAAMGAKEFAVSELPETDWVAHVRRELSPVEAGRFFVYGSHDADKVPEDCEPLLIEAAMGRMLAPSLVGWGLVISIALFPSLLAQLLFIRAVQIIGPVRATTFVNLVPVIAAVFAVYFLGEEFAPYHGVALGIVLLGIWLSERTSAG